MSHSPNSSPRVAFQGEHGAFSEAAAIQLLGDEITTVPRPTFDSAFRAIEEGAADALRESAARSGPGRTAASGCGPGSRSRRWPVDPRGGGR